MARRAPGEGTIIKIKEGKWKAVLSLGTIGGKRVRRTKSAKTKADAAALLRAMRAEAGKAPALAAQRISTADLLRCYLNDFVTVTLEEGTRAIYESTIDNHLIPRIGTVPARDISPLMINSLLADLVRDEVGGRTQQNVFDVLSRALTWAIPLGYVTAHPATGLSRPKHTSKEMRPFDREQAAKLINETAGELTHALLQLALTTGMRQGELFGLEWKRIDFEKCRLRVEQAVAEVKGKLYLKKPKTKRSLRTINLTPDTLVALTEHRKMLITRGRAGEELVFPAPGGGPQSRTNFNHRTWKPLLVKTELDYRGAHNLRHTYATLALGAGVPVHVVSAVMGHSKPSTTLDIYSHALPADQQHATDAMTRLLG